LSVRIPVGTPTLGVHTTRKSRKSQRGTVGGSTQKVLEIVWFHTKIVLIRYTYEKATMLSIVLDDTPYFSGAKNAFPNRNSLLGLQLINNIK